MNKGRLAADLIGIGLGWLIGYVLAAIFAAVIWGAATLWRWVRRIY
jgi:hypothetical protein